MRIAIHTNPKAPWHKEAANNFAKGLRAHGIEPVQTFEHGIDADVYVVWSHHQRKGLKLAQKLGRPYIVMERGYFRDRMKFTSLGWNGLNGRADFCNEDVKGDRWEKHGVEMLPWKSEGAYAIIMGQVDKDASHRDLIDIRQWYQEAARVIKDKTKMQVRFRPHPEGTKCDVPGHQRMTSPCLKSALDPCGLVVTFNSNSAVDAVLAGVPTIACDEGSMAWDVAGHNFDEWKVITDRTQWANKLAYCQWLPSEIRSGEAWEHLKRKLDDKERNTVPKVGVQRQ